jgi:hypothetical protein
VIHGLFSPGRRSPKIPTRAARRSFSRAGAAWTASSRTWATTTTRSRPRGRSTTAFERICRRSPRARLRRPIVLFPKAPGDPRRLAGKVNFPTEEELAAWAR